MAEGVPQVQGDPAPRDAALPLVGEDHLDLGPAGALDQLGEDTRREDGLVVARERLSVGLEQFEQPLVAERRHLDRLTECGPHLALGDCPEHRDVDDDRRGLVEHPDQVLAFGQVDPGLPADRRVDLSHQRGRDMDDGDAPQVDRGEEAGRVAEGTAPDRDQRLRALDPEGGQLTGSAFDDRKPLCLFALGKQDMHHLAATLAQAGRQPLPDGSPGTRLAHQDRPLRPLRPLRLQLGAQRVRGDAVAKDEASDRRRRPQQRRSRRPIRPAELGIHRVDHAMDLGHAGLVDVCGAVEPLAPGGQVAQRPDGVAPRDQRPDVRRAAEALGEDLGPAIEPDRRPSAKECPSIAGIDDRPAARRDDAPDLGGRVGRAEVDDGGSLERPESDFAILREDLRDAATGRGLDPLVEVDQRRAVAIGEPPPDDGLATPREPDQDDVHSVSRPRQSRPHPCRSGRGPPPRPAHAVRPRPGLRVPWRCAPCNARRSP